MLRRALEERDPVGVEFGLYLGHRCGISQDYLDVLLALGVESWHERHEDVVDALAKLKALASVDVLFRTALVNYPYRAYDESNALGVKCIRALGAIQTREAISRLGELMCSGSGVLKMEAETQLGRIERSGLSEMARDVAREVLAAQSGGAKG